MYKFYFIKTKHTLDWLEQLLYIHGYGNTQNVLKVIRDNKGHETDRTIAFLDEHMYTLLLQQNRLDLKIEPFIVPKTFYPDETLYTYNFCIPFPEHSSPSSTSQRNQLYIKQIEHKLAPFITQGLIPRDSYKVTIPVISREKNQTKNLAFFIFHSCISKDILCVIRYILDGTTWDDCTVPFRCHWAKLSSKQANRNVSSK